MHACPEPSLNMIGRRLALRISRVEQILRPVDATDIAAIERQVSANNQRMDGKVTVVPGLEREIDAVVVGGLLTDRAIRVVLEHTKERRDVARGVGPRQPLAPCAVKVEV